MDIKSKTENQELEMVVKNSPNLVNIASPDGMMTFLNEAGQKMLGISQAEVEGYSIMNAFPKNLQEKLSKEMLPALQEKGFWEGDLQYQNAKTKKKIDVHSKCFSIKDEKTGKVKFYVNESSDITEKKRIEKIVENEREKFKTFFDSSNDAIMTLSPPDWKFSDGNAEAIRMFEVKDVKELISLSPVDLSPKNQPNGNPTSLEAKKYIMQALKDGKVSFEWVHKRYEGGNFPARVSLVRIKVKGDDFVMVTVRDTSEEKEIAKKIEERAKNLEKINGLMVGRELKMIELKKEITELKKRLSKK